MVTVKNCSVVSKILAIQIIFYEPRPTNITIPNSITLYAVPVYELHIYIFVALQQGRRMAMEIDESVQCRPQKQQVLFRKKKCMYFDSHHLIVQLANCLLQLQECLDSPALGTSCWAPFARHLLPGTSCRASLTRHLLPASQLSHVASTFF